MNDNGIMRQYIAFAVVILIAIFIVTQTDWSTLSTPNIKQADGGQRFETVKENDSMNQEFDFRDLSAGGVSGASRRSNPKSVPFLSEASTQTTVATGSSVTATSTPFQSGAEVQNPYSGVNVEFSKRK